jgi:hypothetical protein
MHCSVEDFVLFGFILMFAQTMIIFGCCEYLGG